MKREITNLIAINNYQNFIFNRCSNHDAVDELKRETQNVPDVNGIYFVFTPLVPNRNVLEHLAYEINNKLYEFIYFGIAGGLTVKGKEGNQKLKGRINNVVGNNSIRRAMKWNDSMIENKRLFIKVCLLISINNEKKENT